MEWMYVAVVFAFVPFMRRRRATAPTLKQNCGKYIRGSMGTIEHKFHPTIALLPSGAMQRKGRHEVHEN